MSYQLLTEVIRFLDSKDDFTPEEQKVIRKTFNNDIQLSLNRLSEK